jgi:Domain of unknown function (DUF397)
MWAKSNYSHANNNCVEVWRTSSYSEAGNCIEAAGFRTSSHCQPGECVEVAAGVLVRDSKLAEASPVIRFSPGSWARFTEEIKNGNGDLL